MPLPAFAAAAAAVALATPGHGQGYDGRYKLSPEADCTEPPDAPGFIRVEDGVLYGADSACRMTAPVDIRDMDATLYDMQCVGDGAAWQERALVMRGAEGELVLVWDGYAFAYPACPQPAPRPRARPAAPGGG